MSLIQAEHDGRRLLVEIQITPPLLSGISSQNPSIEIESHNIYPFKAIFDTGCTTTAISRNVVSKVGLSPTGKTAVSGNTGRTLQNTYLFRFGFKETKGYINYNNSPINGIEFDNSGFDIDVLIGMDIISLGELTVHRYPAFTFKY